MTMLSPQTLNLGSSPPGKHGTKAKLTAGSLAEAEWREKRHAAA
jgi:hypothetical protein